MANRVESIAYLPLVWQYHEQKKVWRKLYVDYKMSVPRSSVDILINSILGRPASSTTFRQLEQTFGAQTMEKIDFICYTPTINM